MTYLPTDPCPLALFAFTPGTSSVSHAARLRKEVLKQAAQRRALLNKPGTRSMVDAFGGAYEMEGIRRLVGAVFRHEGINQSSGWRATVRPLPRDADTLDPVVDINWRKRIESGVDQYRCEELARWAPDLDRPLPLRVLHRVRPHPLRAACARARCCSAPDCGSSCLPRTP